MRKEKAGMNIGAAPICLVLFLLTIFLFSGCGQNSNGDGSFADPGNDKDFSQLTTPEQQEAAYNYRAYFRPALDGGEQPYVGDTMPFYEDGVY